MSQTEEEIIPYPKTNDFSTNQTFRLSKFLLVFDHAPRNICELFCQNTLKALPVWRFYLCTQSANPTMRLVWTTNNNTHFQFS